MPASLDETETPPGSRRPPGSLRIGSIAGADVLVNASWFLFAALIAWLLAPRVEMEIPGLGVWKYAVGLVYAIVFYLAILLHEASHAFMARHYGFRVESITLHFLGGMTAVDGEARNPRQEFWIAVVGPLTSVAIGIGAYFWGTLLTSPGVLPFIVGGLFISNLAVGVLNMIPGLPLDGGRVLKALVWQVTGSPHRGTIVAGWGGRVTALLVLLWPLLSERLFGIRPTVITWLLAVMIAMFLWAGATAAMSSARLRRKLPSLVARNLARRVVTVPADLPLAEAIRRAEPEQASSIVTVSSDGRPTGLVQDTALAAVPADRRPWVTVATVARSLDPELTLPVGISGEELIMAIGRRPADQYLLVDDQGAIYGVLATADVDRAFREK